MPWGWGGGDGRIHTSEVANAQVDEGVMFTYLGGEGAFWERVDSRVNSTYLTPS